MSNGHILLHRSLLDSAIFASGNGLKIWIWLLCKATYKERHLPIKIGRGESIVTLQRGDVLFGRHKAEEALGIDGSTIYKWIQKMEEMGMIDVRSNSHYTVITICNYDTYQSPGWCEVTANEQPSNSQVTAKEQPSNSQVTQTIQYNKVNKEEGEDSSFSSNEKTLLGSDEVTQSDAEAADVALPPKRKQKPPPPSSAAPPPPKRTPDEQKAIEWYEKVCEEDNNVQVKRIKKQPRGPLLLKLLKEHGRQKVRDMLMSMDNYKKNSKTIDKNNVDVEKTLNKWLNSVYSRSDTNTDIKQIMTF